MMNGYSKIGSSSTTTTSTHKSTRSIDFFSFPPPQAQTPKPIRNLPPTTQREDQGERFGVILGRSSSVSNSSSSSLASGFQATMKRTFSVRRSSSSVTDRYCRIHDQSMAIASDELDEDNNINNKTNRGTRGKILKACKRLFGLSS
jgi:hypothetical protein